PMFLKTKKSSPNLPPRSADTLDPPARSCRKNPSRFVFPVPYKLACAKLRSHRPRLHDAWLRKWHNESPLEPTCRKFRDQLIRNVPRKEHGILGLIFEESRLIQHRYYRSRDVLADLVGGSDFQDAIENAVVEPDIVDQRRCAGMCADSVDAMSCSLDVAQQRVEGNLRLNDLAAERLKFFHRQFRRFLGQNRRNGRAHRIFAGAGCIDTNRSAVCRDSLRMNDFEPMHLK